MKHDLVDLVIHWCCNWKVVGSILAEKSVLRVSECS